MCVCVTSVNAGQVLAEAGASCGSCTVAAVVSSNSSSSSTDVSQRQSVQCQVPVTSSTGVVAQSTAFTVPLDDNSFQLHDSLDSYLPTALQRRRRRDVIRRRAPAVTVATTDASVATPTDNGHVTRERRPRDSASNNENCVLTTTTG